MNLAALSPIHLRYGPASWTSTRLTLCGCMLVEVVTVEGCDVTLWLRFEHDRAQQRQKSMSSSDPFSWSGHVKVNTKEEAIILVLTRLIDCGLLDPFVCVT